MKTQNVTIEKLAEKLGKNVWSKDELKRIYLNDAGYNTKKMSTKTFIYERDGDFRVSVNIDCPSQPDQWIESQENEVRESVEARIEAIIFEINNPGVDYDEYMVQQEFEKEAKQISDAEIKLSEEEKEISELTIENIGNYLAKKGFIDSSFDKNLWDINFHNFQLKIQSRFLNDKDDYPPIIYDHAFSRIFLKSERHADQPFSDAIGKIKVGETTLEFNDIIDFEFTHKQGKNGPNKKNVFQPVSIPKHVTDALNAQLEAEKANRIEHLKLQVTYHTEELTKAIEAYIRKMLPK